MSDVVIDVGEISRVHPWLRSSVVVVDLLAPLVQLGDGMAVEEARQGKCGKPTKRGQPVD